jgi:hypothetical protein
MKGMCCNPSESKQMLLCVAISYLRRFILQSIRDHYSCCCCYCLYPPGSREPYPVLSHLIEASSPSNGWYSIWVLVRFVQQHGLIRTITTAAAMQYNMGRKRNALGWWWLQEAMMIQQRHGWKRSILIMTTLELIRKLGIFTTQYLLEPMIHDIQRSW